MLIMWLIHSLLLYIEEDEFDISDEILNMDALIREIEEEAVDTEEVIANVEYQSLFSDTSLNHLGNWTSANLFPFIACITHHH